MKVRSKSRRSVNSSFESYLVRYANGEWRSTIFRDLVLADARLLEHERKALTFLDVGCGGGFDADTTLQGQLAAAAAEYVGVEPDPEIELGSVFTAVHRCPLEAAPIPPCSVDVAFAVMVLEHLAEPRIFWEKVHTVLRPNGVFWGFTVDGRHPFVVASMVTEKLHIKDAYLNLMFGERGEDRYENYGVYYRSNTPAQIGKMTQSFGSVSTLNLRRIGQLDFYFPSGLKWFGRAYDRVAARIDWPGSLLAVRAQK